MKKKQYEVIFRAVTVDMIEKRRKKSSENKQREWQKEVASGLRH